MSSVLFVHYPEFFSEVSRSQCDMLIRSESTLCMYRERVDINTLPHFEEILARIAPMRRAAAIHLYLLYAGLFAITRMAVPPSYEKFRRRPLFAEDRARMRYHFSVVDECAAGVFVLFRTQKLAFNAFQNAKRLLRQGKPVWVIDMSNTGRWTIKKLTSIPRSLRMNRSETFVCLSEFAKKPRSPLLEAIGWLSGRQS